MDNSKEITAKLSASGKAGASFIVAKGEVEAGGSLGTTRSNGRSLSRTVSSRVAALQGLRPSSLPVVVDDFHYLPRNLQADLVRALKPLIFDGHPVVIIAIPHRRYDALKVEKEMTGRILPVEIPGWSKKELDFIPDTGFRKLNGSLPVATADRLAEESIGSPHLMQEFCRAICRAHAVDSSFQGPSADLQEDALIRVFKETAENEDKDLDALDIPLPKLTRRFHQRPHRSGSRHDPH